MSIMMFWDSVCFCVLEHFQWSACNRERRIAFSVIAQVGPWMRMMERRITQHKFGWGWWNMTFWFLHQGVLIVCCCLGTRPVIEWLQRNIQQLGHVHLRTYIMSIICVNTMRKCIFWSNCIYFMPVCIMSEIRVTKELR
jgi:hypothetical protein